MPPNAVATGNLAPAPGDDAPAPGSARDLADKGKPAPWTEAEDQRAIEIAAVIMLATDTWSRAAEAVATELARPKDGTQWRLRNKLAARIAERMGQLRAMVPEVALNVDPGQTDMAPAIQAALDAAARPALVPVQASVTQPVGSVTRAPGRLVTPAQTSASAALAAHLARPEISLHSAWTLKDDHDLMHFSRLGWPLQDISTELGIDIKACKARYDLLTGLARDPVSDKPLRRFGRDEVLAALVQMLAADTADQAAE